MNRIAVVFLCLMLCLTGIAVPTASAASLTTSTKTALVSCLQQEYLMRDVYQDIFVKYPTLTTFGSVAADEVAMIATLKEVCAKYRIAVPTDARVSAAKTIANTVTSISMAYAVALKLEQVTVTLMDRLLQTTRSRAVATVVTLIKTTSLGSHAAAFAAEQSSVSVPPPAIPARRVVSFTPSQKVNAFLALLSDESVDTIELSGTYHLPYTVINVDRTRPLVVRPAAGATVVFSGASIGRDPQFEFGDGGTAGNITMQGLIFDGFILGQQGVIQARDAHDITLNDMVVRNSRADRTYAQPCHAWALYLSSNATTRPTNFTANRWTVDGSARQMGALQVCGGSQVTATGWSVSNAYFAVYATGTRDSLTSFVLDDWTIKDTGAPTWASPNVSVYVENASGRFSNMRAVSSGILLNMGTPKMIDGGGNSLSVLRPSSPPPTVGGSNLRT